MNAQLTINRESTTAKLTAAHPIADESVFQDMQNRSDAFLANRLRARSVRRNCVFRAGERPMAVDFAI